MFAELPNDMKMFAFLAGELNNSVTYFSTFADVDKESLTKIGTFSCNASDTWKPWKYADRIKVVKQLINLKRKNESKKFQRKQKDQTSHHSLRSKKVAKSLFLQWLNWLIMHTLNR